MKRYMGVLSATVVCFLALGGQQVQGQVPFQRPALGPVNTPAFSPYLNLNRFGGSPALNYYGIVRPQLDMYAATQNLQQQITTNSQAISTAGAATDLPATGHTIRFLNTGRYFLNFGGGGGGQATGGRYFGGNVGGQATGSRAGQTSLGSGAGFTPSPPNR